MSDEIREHDWDIFFFEWIKWKSTWKCFSIVKNEAIIYFTCVDDEILVTAYLKYDIFDFGSKNSYS